MRRVIGSYRYARLCVQVRTPLLLLGTVYVAFCVVAAGQLPLLGLAMMVVGYALFARIGIYRGPALLMVPPVVGPWQVRRSPASQVPSQHVHAYGQAYALDLYFDAEGTGGHPSRHGRWFRRPEEFAGFGQPILAPGGGVVVARSDRRRDHRSRASGPARFLMVIESFWRGLTAGQLAGNHVIIKLDAGGYLLLCHLKQHSVCVGMNERVEQGQIVGKCGSSGYAEEPKLQVQLMDRPKLDSAVGMPFGWYGFEPSERTGIALPRNGETFTVARPVRSAADVV